MRRLPSRQVHLDFHTSHLFPEVGHKFDKKQFQEAIKAGHLNSITVFGKCHHGYCYYPTEVGTIHPSMDPNKDLAGEMMDACHEIGVHAPLYLTIGWSVLDAIEHPDWRARNKDGSYNGYNYDFLAAGDTVRPETSWIHLCTAGGYRQHLFDMTEEACKRYDDLDGLFFDIMYVYDVCYCDSCVAKMKEQGVDIDDEAQAKAFFIQEKKITLDGIIEIIKNYHPEATYFFNSGGAEMHLPHWHYANSHFELEDLPTTWGGYDKMPMRAKYFSGKGKDYLGMTGKFHRSWGEFGGFKLAEALKYECASLLSSGARISVGDQLHPNGLMDMETYRTIGEAYSYVEQIEEYCYDTVETAKLGVFPQLDAEANEAMATLLLDSHLDFDVIHGPEALSKFDVILVPDGYRMDASMGEAVNQYVAKGGKALILGGGALKEETDEFALDLPFSYVSKSPLDKDYFQLKTEVEGMIQSPILCYNSAHYVTGEGEALADLREPYFKRTYDTYCSHYNTPYTEEVSEYPAAIQAGNVIYVAHELSKIYKGYGSSYHRKYFQWLLAQIYTTDRITTNLPTGARVHLTKQEDKNRYVLHVMYAIPQQRGGLCVLEDMPTLYKTDITLDIPETITKAIKAPQNTTVEFTTEDNKYNITLDEFTSHQIIVLEY